MDTCTTSSASRSSNEARVRAVEADGLARQSLAEQTGPDGIAVAAAPDSILRVVAFCLVLLSILAALAVLVYLQDIMVPFTFAFFITCVLEEVQRLVISTLWVIKVAVLSFSQRCYACSCARGRGATAAATPAERQSLLSPSGQQPQQLHVQEALPQRPPATSSRAPVEQKSRQHACGQVGLRVTGVLISVLFLFLLLTALAAVSAFELESLVKLPLQPDWQAKGDRLLHEIIQNVNHLEGLMPGFGEAHNSTNSHSNGTASDLSDKNLESIKDRLLSGLPSMLSDTVLGLSAFSADLLWVVIIVFFMLWSRADVAAVQATQADVSSPHLAEAHRLWLRRTTPSELQGNIQNHVRTYLRLKFVTSLLLALGVLIILFVLGVHGSPLFVSSSVLSAHRQLCPPAKSPARFIRTCILLQWWQCYTVLSEYLRSHAYMRNVNDTCELQCLWAQLHTQAMFTFILNFVPVFGGPIAALLPLPWLALDPEMTFVRGMLAVCLPIAAHTLLANVIEPVLFGSGGGTGQEVEGTSAGEGTELDPTVMLIAMSIW